MYHFWNCADAVYSVRSNDPEKSGSVWSSTDQFMEFCGSAPIQYRNVHAESAERPVC